RSEPPSRRTGPVQAAPRRAAQVLLPQSGVTSSHNIAPFLRRAGEPRHGGAGLLFTLSKDDGAKEVRRFGFRSGHRVSADFFDHTVLCLASLSDFPNLPTFREKWELCLILATKPAIFRPRRCLQEGAAFPNLSATTKLGTLGMCSAIVEVATPKAHPSRFGYPR